jgi:predicted HTH transcriptional regulator
MRIDQLITSPEGKTLEFKRDLSSPRPMLKTLLAFANTAGGRLIVGVADDRQVIGVEYPGMRLRFIVPLAKRLKIPATRESGVESGAQSGAQSKAILNALRDARLSANELTEVLGLKSKTGAFKRTVKALLSHHLIEYTIPDKHSSRLQKYRLTPKGTAVIKAQRSDDKEKAVTGKK